MVTNAGPSSAAGVALVDSLPAGVTFMGATDVGSHAGGVITWPSFTLASGSTRSDTVRVAVATEGTYANVVRATSSSVDPDSADARVSQSTVVGALADLGLTMSLLGPAVPLPGDTLVYVVTVSNAGPSTATGIALSDTVPTGSTFVSATNSGTHAAGVVTWPAFTLANGATRSDTVRLVAPSTPRRKRGWRTMSAMCSSVKRRPTMPQESSRGPAAARMSKKQSQASFIAGETCVDNKREENPYTRDKKPHLFLTELALKYNSKKPLLEGVDKFFNDIIILSIKL